MATATSNDTLGTGRRKSSVARVRIRAGAGKITVNQRSLDDYFYSEKHRMAFLAPVVKTILCYLVELMVGFGGGGITGQADACKLGIARALKLYNAELEDGLRDSGLLTRDGRMKERKKYGLRGARRGTQFSKR